MKLMKLPFLIFSLALYASTLALASSVNQVNLGNLFQNPNEKIIDFNLTQKQMNKSLLKKKDPIELILKGYIAPKSTELGAIYLKRKIGQKNYSLKIWITNSSLCLGTDSDCSLFSLCTKDTIKIMQKYHAIIPTSLLVKLVNQRIKAIPTTIQPISPEQLTLTAQMEKENTCSKQKVGLRLIARKAELNGVQIDLADILKNPKLALLLSESGPINLQSLLQN